MKKLFSWMTGAALALSALNVNAAATEFYVVTATDAWQNNYDGIWSFTLQNASSDFTMVYNDLDACNTLQWPNWYMRPTSYYYYGGNHDIMGYYGRKVSNGYDYYIEKICWLKYSMSGETFERSLFAEDVIPAGPGVYENVWPNLLTYNPVNGKIYGTNNDYEIIGNSTKFWISFYEVDPATGVRGSEPFEKLNSLAANSLATDAKGVTYFTTTKGDLYSISLDPVGTPKKIGNIDIINNNTMWSCFDYSNGKLYLMKDYDIYEVDVTNATSKKVANIPVQKNASIRGFFNFAEMSQSDKQSPAAPTDLKVSYPTAGQLASKISVKAPSTYFDNSTMTEPVTIKFYVGNDDTPVDVKKNVAAGSEVTVDYTFPAVGQYEVTAVASNENGNSSPLMVKSWAGFDTPAAPENVTLVINADGTYRVNWDAVSSVGIHGGAIDESAITYTLTWHPYMNKEKDITGTTSVGRLDYAPFAGYFVSVKAVAGGIEGVEGNSNTVQFGESLETPWYDDFTNSDTFSRFVVKDEGTLNTTWEFKNYFNVPAVQVNGFNLTDSMNDWLISPPITKRAGGKYTITYTAFGGVLDADDNVLEVYVGSTNDVATMTKISTADDDIVKAINSIGSMKAKSLSYTADADGVLYVAFHAASDAGHTLAITNVAVTAEAVPGAPLQVSELSVVPGDKGALNATVSFKAPTRTNDDKALESIKYIQVFRNNSLVPVKVFENPEPGAELSFVDNVPAAASYVYDVYCYNDKGIGEKASETVWVGEDLPAAPRNLKIEEVTNSEGEFFKLTWDAPEKAKNGGYIDIENLTYAVEFYMSVMESPFTFAEGLTERECYIPVNDFKRLATSTGGQISIDFYVIPFSAAGMGDYTGDTVLYGESYELPFKEPFAPTGMQSTPWGTLEVASEYYRAWTYCSDEIAQKVTPAVSSQDGNGGLAMFYQTQTPVYEERLISPRITKAGKKDVAIEFYMWHDSDLDDQFAKTNYVIIEAGVGNQYVQLSNPIYVKDGKGWVKHTVSLDGLNYDEFRLSLRGSSAVAMPLYLDNIVIKDDTETPIEVILAPVTNLGGIKDATSGDFFLRWSEPEHLSNITISGYNVYCNSTKLNSEPVAATIYQVAEPQPTDEYYVTVVYAQGESAPSNIVKGGDWPSAVFDINVEEVVCNAFAIKGGIVVEGNDAAYHVYTLNGAEVATGRVFGNERLNIEKGIYIVRVGGKVVKCMVR